MVGIVRFATKNAGGMLILRFGDIALRKPSRYPHDRGAMSSAPAFRPYRRQAGGRKYQAIMYVCGDDSVSGDFVCLAGYLANDILWDALHNQWESLLREYRLPFLHASDFLNGRKEYVDYCEVIKTYEDRVAAIDRFCGLAKKFTAYGFVASANQKEFGLGVAGIKASKFPLRFLFYRVMAQMYDKMLKMGVPDDEPIAFIFDDSESEAPRMYNVWSKARKYKSFARRRLGAITFADDKLMTGLQAADLLAYSLGREYPGGRQWPLGTNSPFKRILSQEESPLEWEHWDAAMFAANPDIVADYGTID